MSYDLTLFRPPQGVEPLEAWHRIQSGDGGLVAGSFNLVEIADLLQSRVPDLQRSPAGSGEWIELDHDAQVQVLISDREVGIGMPYFRNEVGPMMNVVAACIETLGEAGFVAYDRQLDKIVTAADFSAMTAQYRDTDKVLPLIREHAKRRSAARKPWWKFW